MECFKEMIKKIRKCKLCGEDISNRSLRTIYCSSYCCNKVGKERFNKKHGNKNKLRREIVLNRDNIIKEKGSKCYFCKKKEGLEIHHLNYNNNNLKNLLLLCSSCHKKIHIVQRMLKNVLK